MAKVGRLVKELMVQELSEALREHPNWFVTSLGRLEATEADALRKRLRATDATLLMVKRTLGLRGISALGIDGAQTLFTGSVGLVLTSEEAPKIAKIIVEFAKANEDKLIIRGGLVDGQLLDQKRVEELAHLPSKPELIARLIGVLESPIVSVVMVLEQVLGEPAWVLEEASKQQPAAAPAQPHTAAPEATSQAPESAA